MRRQLDCILSILVLSLVLTGCGPTSRREPTVNPAPDPKPSTGTALQGDYLGQQPPGSSPKVFASRIITGELHTPPVFTPDGDEAYWSLQGGTIMMTRLGDDGWTQPESVAFPGRMQTRRWR